MYQNRDLLMTPLSKFFNNRERVERVLNILKGENLSLRLVDWFITNYARKHDVIITKSGSGGPLCINIHLSYRSQLKSYSKQQFDPFRRHERIEFKFEDIAIETTVGQLNFFRWAIENDVLDYIERNKAALESAMMDSHARNDSRQDGTAGSGGSAGTTGAIGTAGLAGSAGSGGSAHPPRAKRCVTAVAARRQECKTVIRFD